MTDQELLAQLKLTMDQLENNFDDLYQAAPTDEDKLALRHRLTAARDAYWTAVARGLKDQNEFVSGLADDLVAQNKALASQISGLKDFATFLTVAADAVKLAASIATLAAAA